MRKYVLHPQLEIIESQDVKAYKDDLNYNKDILTKIKQGELHILCNKKRDKVFLINPSIHLFLTFFKKPQSLNIVIEQFAKKIAASLQEVQPIVEGFFKDMCQKSILVTVQSLSHIQRIESAETLLPKSTFKNYIILSPLSIQKHVQIYIAKNPKTKEKLVLKIAKLPENIPLFHQKYRLKRFHQEFELMHEVGTHQHICALKEWHKEENYAVLEYIEGKSIHDLSEDLTFSLEQRLSIFCQTLEALSALHQKSVLHGDIHSQNFIMQNTGQVKMIDFDLANREKLKRHEFLNHGGVHEYLAPEKMDENALDMVVERSDYRSEVYQMGVLLYRILYGKMPFEGDTWSELFQKIKNVTPNFDSNCFTHELISEAVLAFLKKCLSKNPKQRFDNASAALLYFKENINIANSFIC